MVPLFRILGNRRTGNLLLPLVYSLLPAIFLTGVSFIKPIYQDKQFLVIIPPLLILAGWTLSRRKPVQLLLGLALFTALTATPLLQTYTVRQKQQWREASRFIEAHWKPGDAVYYNAGVASAATAFYLDDSLPQIGYPTLWDIQKGGRYGSLTDAAEVNAQFSDLVTRYERLWLIQYYPSYWDHEGHILGWLDERACRKAVPDFHGVDLRLYDLTAK
jgi:hypothetical protein